MRRREFIDCPIYLFTYFNRIGLCRRDVVNSPHLPRSSSIDSMVEAVWTEGATSSMARPSISRPERLSLVSPSVSRRLKGHRGINGEIFAFQQINTIYMNVIVNKSRAKVDKCIFAQFESKRKKKCQRLN